MSHSLQGCGVVLGSDRVKRNLRAKAAGRSAGAPPPALPAKSGWKNKFVKVGEFWGKRQKRMRCGGNGQGCRNHVWGVGLE